MTCAGASKPSSISAFFPCYDDEATIGMEVERVAAVLDRLGIDGEIVVVNDGSRDQSAMVLEEMQNAEPRLRVVTHDQNRGYGAALQSGFAAATGEWVFYTDGDGQYDPDQLDRLVALVHDDVDVVQGYKLGRSDSLLRRVVGRLYHRVVSVVFGLQVRDTDCDFRLIRGDALRHVRLGQTSGAICVELVRKLQTSGARFVEVGVDHYPRVNGSSRFFRPRNVARTLRGLFGLWLEIMVLRRNRERSGAETPRRWRPAWGALPWVLLFGVTLTTAVRVPAGRADEAWFLWVAQRAEHGARLYRDVYYVSTPLAIWIMQGATKMFGTHVSVERALASLCFVASAAIVCAIARRTGMPRAGRLLLVVALFVFASPVAYFASVYSMLAVAASLGALLAMLRWIDRESSVYGRPAPGLIGVGFLCGVAFASKPNTGLLALGAVAVTVVVSSRRARQPDLGRLMVRVAGGFGAAVSTMLLPIVLAGTTDAFMGDVFTGKGQYVSLLGGRPFSHVATALNAFGSGKAPIGLHLVATDLLLPFVVPVLVVVIILRSRDLRSSPTFVALVAFAGVGIGCAAPDFGPQHVTEAVPLLLGVSVVLLVWTRPFARATALPWRLVLVPVAASLVVVAVSVSAYARRPRVAPTDHVVNASLAHFDGTMISARNEVSLRADLADLRADTHGSVFIVRAQAAFYYLAGGLRDPTPFDFPAVTDFGSGGQRGVLTLLRRTHTRWVCLPAPPRPRTRSSSTAPLELERGLARSYHLVERLHLCDLYTARAHPVLAKSGSPPGASPRTGQA
jgi:hypothetical protein